MTQVRHKIRNGYYAEYATPRGSTWSAKIYANQFRLTHEIEAPITWLHQVRSIDGDLCVPVWFTTKARADNFFNDDKPKAVLLAVDKDPKSDQRRFKEFEKLVMVKPVCVEPDGKTVIGKIVGNAVI